MNLFVFLRFLSSITLAAAIFNISRRSTSATALPGGEAQPRVANRPYRWFLLPETLRESYGKFSIIAIHFQKFEIL